MKASLLPELNHHLVKYSSIIVTVYETSGSQWHLAPSRWRANMPITDVPFSQLDRLALSDSTLKSENDTSEELIWTKPLHQSVTKAQRNSNTGLSQPHDQHRQGNQTLGIIDSKERKKSPVRMNVKESCIVKQMCYMITLNTDKDTLTKDTDKFTNVKFNVWREDTRLWT